MESEGRPVNDLERIWVEWNFLAFYIFKTKYDDLDDEQREWIRHIREAQRGLLRDSLNIRFVPREEL